MDCKDLGRLVAPEYRINGRGLCKRHYSGRLGQPIRETAENVEDSTPKRVVVDWTAVQRDRDAGVPVADLVKKYGVSNPVIYVRTHGNGKRAQRRPTDRPKKNSLAKGRMNHGGGFNGLLSDELASLRQKRDALTEIIELMEAMSK
jgi:hypothetical protein